VPENPGIEKSNGQISERKIGGTLMENFRIATKYNKETEGEKCPNCRYIFQNFLDIGYRFGWGQGILWACMSCGMLFVPKKARLGIRASVKMVIEQQMRAEKEIQEMKEGQMAELEDTAQPIPINNQPYTPEIISFSCPQCKFKAKSKAGLGLHMRRHKEKPVLRPRNKNIEISEDGSTSD